MVGWHHGLSGHEFSKLWEMVMDREFCSPWACKGSDTTELLENNKVVMIWVFSGNSHGPRKEEDNKTEFS